MQTFDKILKSAQIDQQMIETIFELALEFQKRNCSEYYKLKFLSMVKLRDTDKVCTYLQTNNVAHKSTEIHNYTQLVIQETD